MWFDFEDLVVWLYRYPAFFRASGMALLRLGTFGLIVGIFAKVVTVISPLAPAPAPPVGIDAHIPALWTWWVPETPASLAMFTAIAVAGALMATAAKKAQRQLRNF